MARRNADVDPELAEESETAPARKPAPVPRERNADALQFSITHGDKHYAATEQFAACVKHVARVYTPKGVDVTQPVIAAALINVASEVFQALLKAQTNDVQVFVGESAFA